MFRSFPPPLVSLAIDDDKVLGFDIAMCDSDVVASLHGVAHLREHSRDEAQAFARQEGVAVRHGGGGGQERWRRRRLIHQQVSGSVSSDGPRERPVVRVVVIVVIRIHRVLHSIDVVLERTAALCKGFSRRRGRSRVQVVGTGILRFEEPEEEVVSGDVFEDEEQPIVGFVSLYHERSVVYRMTGSEGERAMKTDSVKLDDVLMLWERAVQNGLAALHLDEFVRQVFLAETLESEVSAISRFRLSENFRGPRMQARPLLSAVRSRCMRVELERGERIDRRQQVIRQIRFVQDLANEIDAFDQEKDSQLHMVVSKPTRTHIA